MKRLLVFCVLAILSTFQGISLYAQDPIYSQELAPLEIESVRVIRTADDLFTLEVDAIATTCGELITHTLYSSNHIGLSPQGAMTVPDGDRTYRVPDQYTVDVSLFTLPTTDDFCDLDDPVTVNLPLESIPTHWLEDGRRWDGIVLVNDFATWFYVGESVEELPDIGQAAEIGTTELERWQKVDSVIHDLTSVGAIGPHAVLWLEGVHPDGCEFPTRVNVIPHLAETDHFIAEIFRLLPLDVICPKSLQPFLVDTYGVVLQLDFLLDLTGQSKAMSFSTLEIIPTERRYPEISVIEVEQDEAGYGVVITATLAEECDAPLSVVQGELDGIPIVSVYYDIYEEVTCTEGQVTFEETIEVTTLPVIINGLVVSE